MDQAMAVRRAEMARATRVVKRTGDTAELDELRRNYAAAKIEAAVREVVGQAPPLTADQRARISALLRGAV